MTSPCLGSLVTGFAVDDLLAYELAWMGNQLGIAGLHR